MKSWAVAGWDALTPRPARVAVHPGQEPTGHPFGRRWRRRGSGPGRRNPPAASAASATATRPGASVVDAGQSVYRGDAAQLQMAADHPGRRRIVAVEGQPGVVGATRSCTTVRRRPVRSIRARPRPPARSTAAATLPGPARPAVRTAGHADRRRRRGRRGDLGVHPLDRFGIQGADGREVDVEAPSQAHGVGPSILEFLVIEKGIGAGGDDLVGEDRRFGGIAAMDRGPRPPRSARGAGAARRCPGPRARCRRSSGAPADGRGSRWGRWRCPGRRRPEETRRQQVVGFHALDRRRVAPAVAEPQDQSATG